MRSVYLAAVAVGALAAPARADFIDTVWTVAGFTGEYWYADPSELIGQTQEFHTGFAAGVFYSCDAEGQSATYTTYSLEDFLANPEFILFDGLGEDLFGVTEKLFVHRITCAGNRRVMYPFVTTETRDTAYYLFEGGIYLLEAQ